MFRTFWKFVGVAVMALAVSAPVSHAKQRIQVINCLLVLRFIPEYAFQRQVDAVDHRIVQ